MDIKGLEQRRASQSGLVVATEAMLKEAIDRKWVLAQKELRTRLARQKAALANTEAIIAEITGKK